MAHTASAKKRIRQNSYQRSVNRWRKRRIHSAMREFDQTLHSGSAEEATTAFRSVCSILDKVAGKGTIHRNNASRRKGRLAKRLNTRLAGSK